VAWCVQIRLVHSLPCMHCRGKPFLAPGRGWELSGSPERMSVRPCIVGAPRVLMRECTTASRQLTIPHDLGLVQDTSPRDAYLDKTFNKIWAVSLSVFRLCALQLTNRRAHLPLPAPCRRRLGCCTQLSPALEGAIDTQNAVSVTVSRMFHHADVPSGVAFNGYESPCDPAWP
jgi:hypothetical protein